MVISTKFRAVVESETRLGRDARTMDRDVKGNALVYRSASDASTDPDAPTIEPWSQKDYAEDKVPGTGTARARAELGLGEGVPVTVAVIDSGMDISHPALQDHIWTNPAPNSDPRTPGALHGWNFLGSANANVYHTTLEVTRELKRLQDLSASRELTATEQAELDKVQDDYNTGKGQAAVALQVRTKSRDQLAQALDVLRTACLIKDGTLAEVQAIQSSNPAIIAARDAALVSLKQGRDLKWYEKSIAHWAQTVQLNDQYYYNLNFSSSTIVGDNPAKMDDAYGNANVMPEASDEEHATHVAGIIGALRAATVDGMVGQASNVKIMSLRAVPDGDERDKDIGNAIRFAVDHGARVINMSFGKSYSPNRDYVWQMLKYAADHNVLIVHAAVMTHSITTLSATIRSANARRESQLARDDPERDRSGRFEPHRGQELAGRVLGLRLAHGGPLCPRRTGLLDVARRSLRRDGRHQHGHARSDGHRGAGDVAVPAAHGLAG